MFTTHGIPESIVSDNVTVFASEEFTEFVTMNGILHIRSAPYHPATNGLAECAVQTLKESLKKKLLQVLYKQEFLVFFSPTASLLTLLLAFPLLNC